MRNGAGAHNETEPLFPGRRQLLPAWCWQAVLTVAYRAARLSWRVLPSTGRGVIVAVRVGDRLLMVQHSYRPGLDLPGGGVDRSESELGAALRELEEELGLRAPAEEMARLGSEPADYGRRRIQLTIFEWQTSELARVVPDGREILWATLVPLEDIPNRRTGGFVERYLRLIERSV
ncbi:MAG: NUDIX domain-containing protein [Geminicoccaceae bacterium]